VSGNDVDPNDADGVGSAIAVVAVKNPEWLIQGVKESRTTAENAKAERGDVILTISPPLRAATSP
jgi:hypothetical protein